ncbi:exosome nuclease subunit [Haplosporangium sp. Z 767]|nr:exosome nuclease subunit [Haplosporangium sp. Z 767]KAF9191992.1 exosome nuclease subunit [Haplosporangium sp. Z 11]
MTSKSSIVDDFDAWQSALFSTLVKATKAANAIPANDVSFYRTLDHSFSVNMDDASAATLDLCNGLLQQAGGVEVEELKEADDMKDRFDIIVDVVDNMLEKVDVVIDEMKAPRKKGSSTISQSAPMVALAKNNKLEYKLIHAQNIARPQLRFPDPVDNSSAPFIRKIKYKPNAKVDLNYGMDRSATADSSSSELIEQPHPYEYEITHLDYPEHMFEARPEQLYLPFETTSAIWVDTEEALKDMCRTLEMQREIAIDLEHHNYRSFQGFVCLMQISTRDQDYVVDTLELRGSLHLLNQSFTDPNIVKVLHGAESDIIWLQRDFGVYIVNLFDTYHATKVLEFGSHSLAHLLKLYADFDADKRYQLADWRIRPLPKEMLSYARSDTHFLLYIYDRMRNALLDKSNPTTHNLLHATLQRSAETALRTHHKEIYDAEDGEGPNGWRNLYSKWNRALDNQQFAVFKALHAWRDQTARDEDESHRYILPGNMLFTLAEKMPVDSAQVLACCNPIPPSVKMNATDIAMLISRTKASVAHMVGGFKPVEINVPVHVRFDPATGLARTEEGKEAANATKGTGPSRLTPLEKASQSMGAKVIAATSSGLFGKGTAQPPSTAKPLADPATLMANRSGLFGDLSASKSSQAEEEAKKIVERIKLEISTSARKPTPVFVEVSSSVPTATTTDTTVDSAAEKAKEEVLFTPAEERATKQKRTDVLMLSSMSKKRSRALDEDRAELAQESGASVASSGSENVEADEVVKTKKKKGKKVASSAQASVASSQSSSAQVSGDEVPEAFKPFDYNSVRSVVDETMSQAGSSSKKQKKKARAAPESPTPFDPYNKLEEKADFKKKDASFSRAPKSGARSMTFGRQ